MMVISVEVDNAVVLTLAMKANNNLLHLPYKTSTCNVSNWMLKMMKRWHWVDVETTGLALVAFQ